MLRPDASRGVRRRIGALPAGFQQLSLGRRVIYLRRDLVFCAAALVSSLSKLDSAQGSGNRASGYALTLENGIKLFARVNRRGGLLRWMLKDLYVGIGARPARELAITAEARRRHIAVAEPIATVLEWVGPLLYRSVFITRALGGMTLWQFLRTDDDALVATHVIQLARQAIDTMHQRGLFHADLNLHNVFINQARESFEVVILDLDKAQLFDRPLPAWMRARNLIRLRRSARKLDPGGRYLDCRALQLLTR